MLVNNAANFYGGYFEELTPEQIEDQLATGLIGPMNVTRAVLPVMRKQRSGHIISISSGAGLSGFEFNSAYAAAKFGLEGWMESLQPEVAPVRHHHHHRQPRVLPHRSPDAGVDDLRRRRPLRTTPSAMRERVQWYESMNGQQAGDPAKLAHALITIASQEQPPRRFIAGADAIGIAEQKAKDLQEQANAFRDLSTSLAREDA